LGRHAERAYTGESGSYNGIYLFRSRLYRAAVESMCSENRDHCRGSGVFGMYTLRSVGWLVACQGLLLALLLAACRESDERAPSETAGAASEAECQALRVDTTQLAGFVRRIQETAGKPTPGAFIGLDDWSITSVRAFGHCLSVLALSWANHLEGGIVVLDSSNTIRATGWYPGASRVVSAGRGRFAFVFTAVKGPGIVEKRLVVRCPLSPDIFLECLDLLIESYESVQAYEGGPENAAWLRQTAEMSFKGDTLILFRRAVVKRPGDPVQSEQTLGAAKLVLPR